MKYWYRQSKHVPVCQLQLDVTAYVFSLIFSHPPVSTKAVGDLAIFPISNNLILAERATQNGP